MINYIVRDLVEVINQNEGNVAFATTADFAMGSGVAKQLDKRFNLRFPFKDRFDKFCPDAGDVYHLENLNDDKLFCLISKRTRYDGVDLNTLEKCFRALRQEMISTRVSEIYIPKIGCGADGLYWEEDVLPIVERVFGEGTPFTVNVCVMTEEEIPSDYVTDNYVDDDLANGVIDLKIEDLLYFDERSGDLTVSKFAYDDFEDGKVVDVRVVDAQDNMVHSYKMVLDWDDGIIMKRVPNT